MSEKVEDKSEAKVYHIYAKDRCLYHNLEREDFEEKWEMLHNMVELMTGYKDDIDLQFEEISDNIVNKGPHAGDLLDSSY
jgi:hypothetical protein